jgi:hypothetical protein
LPQAVIMDMYSKKGAIRRVHGRGSYFVGCICIDLVKHNGPAKTVKRDLLRNIIKIVRGRNSPSLCGGIGG